MPPPSAPDPQEPRALSAHERAILDRIEHDLDADAPDLAREMARPITATAPLPRGLVEGGFLVVSLFLVLAAAGLVPGVVWALLGVVGAMVVVPWVMLRAFEKLERAERPRPDGDGPPA
jgi:hypothetical protein